MTLLAKLNVYVNFFSYRYLLLVLKQFFIAIYNLIFVFIKQNGASIKKTTKKLVKINIFDHKNNKFKIVVETKHLEKIYVRKIIYTSYRYKY